MREHEPGLSLHEREVPPAERRLLGRRQKQVAGAVPELFSRRALLLVLFEGEDQLAERLQPAVAKRVGDDLEEGGAREAAVDPLEVLSLGREHGLVKSEKCSMECVFRSSHATSLYGRAIELGVYTFAELTDESVTAAQRLRNLLEEVELADQVGLDVFGIGEHHRPDFAVSSPAVVLAAAAERTKRIRLTSAVSVLSSDDPVRVFQQFATVDLLSGGRAEIMAGRGSFIESFPLFGYDLADYDRLFADKLDELLEIRDGANERGVYPRPLQEQIPIWVAVGGTPESAARAGALGLPMALAIIGGRPEQFAPFAEIHRRAAIETGHVPPPPLSINSHGLVAEGSQEAADIAFPGQKLMMDRIGRERGWPPLRRQDFEASRTLRGASFIGSPEEVIEKILFQYEIFKHDRFLIQFSVGSVPHNQLLRSIELFGTEVAPAIRKAIPQKPS